MSGNGVIDAVCSVCCVLSGSGGRIIGMNRKVDIGNGKLHGSWK